jgi:hypothetical protein
MLRTFWALLVVAVMGQAAGPAPTPSASALSSDPKGWTDLLADTSLKQWTRVGLGAVGQLSPGDITKATPWSLDPASGVLTCHGDQSGHEMFRFSEEAGDFIFHAEWRYTGPPDAKAYNSGIFARASADGSTWHQAQTGPTGGYLFAAIVVDGKPVRINARDKMAENRVKPAGEWNVYEIRATGKTMTLWVNGAVVNEVATEVLRGYIGLEVEGYLVEFRNLKLKPLDPAR